MGYTISMQRTRSRVVSFLILSVVAVLFSFAEVHAQSETPEERRARLERELAEIEKDIVEKRGVLSEKQKERQSLERDIAVLERIGYEVEYVGAAPKGGAILLVRGSTDS